MESTTLIIATIGPSSGNEEVLTRMVEAGMDMARLNMSWGTHESHGEYIKTLRKVGEILGKEIPIIMDLSGPRIKEEHGHHVDTSASLVITEKDKEDITFGVLHKIEYFAMSYVKDKQDIVDLKELLTSHNHQAKVIAKIERKEAVDSFEGIAGASDMVMIARGDLGNEYPLGEIPFVEKTLLTTAKALSVPVIVATQMLLSTTYQEEPTRAEVTDEVFALINGADGVMLSEETANGKFPVEAVIAMEEIASRTERYHHDAYEN